MPKKFLFIIADFILIVIIVLIMSHQIDNYKGLKQVYVAKTTINKGAQITADMVEPRSVTLNRAAAGGKDRVAYYEDTVQDSKDVVGQYAKYDFIAGEIIVKEKLQQTQAATGDQYMYTMPKGYYAYPIPAGGEGKANLIKVDDYVDLFITTKNQGVIDDPAFKHLRVYDLKSDKGQSIAGGSKDDSGQTITPEYIILALNDYQLQKLVAYQADDTVKIHIAIRQRPQAGYEIFNNDAIPYPAYSVAPNTLIDEAAEQQIIDENKFKQDNKNFNDSTASSSQQTNNANTQPNSVNTQTNNTSTQPQTNNTNTQPKK